MHRIQTRQPTNPGTILREMYLEERSLGVSQFAQMAGLHRKTLSSILNGHSAITADSAIAIADVLDTTPELWLNLQNKIDLYQARQRRQRKNEKANNLHP
jgi:addiction module HigA family antidote